MKKIIVLVAILALLAIGVPTLATEDTDNANVSITVSSQLWIDITPEAMHWTGTVNPGSLPDCDTTGDEGSSCLDVNNLGTYANHDVYGIEMENIGSDNISHIWLNTTIPDSNPFATGEESAYDAANMLAVSLSNASGFHFINRKEFAMPRKPIYLQVPAGVGGVDSDNTGRLRSGNQERFWALAPADGVSGECNVTGTTMYITTGNVHNETDTGDTDLTDESGGAGEIAITQCSNAAAFGCGNVSTTLNGETQSYAVVVDSDCSYVYFTRFNADLIAYHTDLMYDEGYLWDNDTRGQTFNPGNYTPIYVEARIPYGTSAGSLTTGYMRVFADDT